MNSDTAIVVIPARGGSKRFPRKNIAPLAGKPLLAYSIEAGLAAATIDGVYVSTEDHEIAQVAETAGARVPYRRPQALAGDTVTADEAVAHLVRHLQSVEGANPAIVVLIQPTSPFVKAEHIDAAVTKLRDEPTLDSVTTMSRLDHRKHPYNLSFVRDDGSWEFMFAKERSGARTRQSKPPAQMFCNLFAVRTQTLLDKGRFGDRKGSVPVDDLYAWDIDFPWELDVAGFLIEEGLVDLSHRRGGSADR